MRAAAWAAVVVASGVPDEGASKTSEPASPQAIDAVCHADSTRGTCVRGPTLECSADPYAVSTCTVAAMDCGSAQSAWANCSF